MGSSYSSVCKIKKGVPQGSMQFYLFINDPFLIDLESEIGNSADDNTIYTSSSTFGEVINNLENDLTAILQWFTENGMAANPKKFQLMFLGLRIIGECV